MVGFIMRFVLLISHLIYSIKIFSSDQVTIYGKKRVTGNSAILIAIILLIGGLLSPLIGSIAGWAALGIAIVIGLFTL